MSAFVQVAILAGGRGTRFWPLSRKRTPKQFLNLLDPKRSMIQVTSDRVRKAIAPDLVSVITGEEYEGISQDQLPDAEVIVEPMGRNTAAAVGLAAFDAKERSSEAVIVILPADHSIEAEDKYAAVLSKAVNLAVQTQQLVTLGIKPDSPHTGYGYIKAASDPSADSGAPIERFVEKPDLETAESFLAEGGYLWNAGMFILPVSVFLEELQQFEPTIFEGLERFWKERGSLDAEGRRELFAQVPAMAVDVAVFERTKRALVVAAEDIEWSDVGAWDAWGEKLPADDGGNRFQGNFLSVDSHNCIGLADGRQVALLGVKDLVVVDTEEILMICPVDRCQEVKRLIASETE